MKIGETLHITFESDDGNIVKCHSKIVDLRDKELLIGYPIHEETQKTIYLPQHTTFTVTYRDNMNVYEFQSFIVGRKIETLPVLIIDLPPVEKRVRIQRRRYVRIDTAVDVALQCTEDTFAPLTSTTKDISGGGLSVFVHEQIFNKDIPVKLTIVLRRDDKAFDYIFTEAKFVRYIPLEDNLQIASFQFIDLDQKDQQKIITYCFQKEREQRKQQTLLDN